ncbi:MAG: restriction endonuclease [Abitibacteriaceae bacterium]|nr:restriction endonuclease [Abditibacteriaceae bacterium]
MIENPHPVKWQDLQTGVCRLFNEIGLAAEETKQITTPRGSVEIDVYAVDINSVDKIQYVVECKNWTSSIPQSVVHSFTTVMHEIGANIGFIISLHGFQSGARDYISNTNIIGLTYAELQLRYFETWHTKFFVTQIGKHVDALAQYVEMFNCKRDREVSNLSEAAQIHFHELVKKYQIFGTIMNLFEFPCYSPQFNIPAIVDIEEFKDKLNTHLSPEFHFHSIYYRDLLHEIISHVDQVTDEFNNVLGRNIFEQD